MPKRMPAREANTRDWLLAKAVGENGSEPRAIGVDASEEGATSTPVREAGEKKMKRRRG